MNNPNPLTQLNLMTIKDPEGPWNVQTTQVTVNTQDPLHGTWDRHPRNWVPQYVVSVSSCQTFRFIREYILFLNTKINHSMLLELLTDRVTGKPMQMNTMNTKKI